MSGISSFRDQFEHKLMRARPSYERMRNESVNSNSEIARSRAGSENASEESDSARKADKLLHKFEEHQRWRKTSDGSNADKTEVKNSTWSNDERQEYPLRSLAEKNFDSRSFSNNLDASHFNWVSVVFCMLYFVVSWRLSAFRFFDNHLFKLHFDIYKRKMQM